MYKSGTFRWTNCTIHPLQSILTCEPEVKDVLVFQVPGTSFKTPNGFFISELQGITCHMGSQCYLPPDTSKHTPP